MDLASVVRQAIKVAGESGIKAGEAAVIAAYPWLGWPVIKQLWTAVIEKFLSGYIKSLMDESTKILIPIINENLAEAAEAESEKLKALLDNSKTTEAELSRELEIWKRKYSDLIRMRVAAPDN